jgi:H+-transporting ATPase
MAILNEHQKMPALFMGVICWRRDTPMKIKTITPAMTGMVLTEPGLACIFAAVKEGRIIMTGQAILTPLLMVLIMITGDFLGMSLTTDNVRPSPVPNAWRIGNLTVAGVIMGLGELVFCASVLAFGAYRLGFDISAYTNRERRHLWSSHPSFWVVFSSIADLLIASTLAIGGIAMTPLPASLVVGTLAAAAVFAVILDLVKVPVFRRLGIT